MSKKVEVTLERKNPSLDLGLTEEDVKTRKELGYQNITKKGSTKSIGRIILKNVVTVFNLLNFGIGAWLISIGEWTQCFFLVIITCNLLIGIYQEIKAKNMIDKLSLLSAPTARVIRDGKSIEIEIKDIVIDDILEFQGGKQICSDCIVQEGMVEVNESLLTGESDAIVKKAGDQLFSGSFVVSGTCKALVSAVGENNYIEKLTGEAKKYMRPRSDLMKSLKLIIRTVGCLIVIMGPLYFVRSYNFGNGLHYGGSNGAVATTAGAIIGMIPSGLFLLTSVALFMGVIRLAMNNTLVQELYCIEMLARVDVLCLDKTGTITDGTMTVQGVVEYKNDSGIAIRQVVSAMLNAINDDNLTSVALEAKFGREKRLPAKTVVPFSSQRKYSACEFDKFGSFFLGAPEFVLKNSYSSISYDVERNASLGYRVLVVGYSPNPIVDNYVEGEIQPLGLILIEDTIRPDAIETIDYFKKNNVSVRVISGDNPITVAKVSERAGIENANHFISLDGLSDAEVVRAANEYTVFGRVTPGQKRLLIQSIKSDHHIVAMTGDGVNDILALKEADCSIAMASGSEAARNVSHLVLLDSNFASMPKVVNEGRRVINNVEHVATLFLTKTLFSTMLLALTLILGESYPIVPKQLMIIDFLVIAIPSFVLALEPNNNIVKGNFLRKVFKTAFPGALTIVISALVVILMSKALGFGVAPEGATELMKVYASREQSTIIVLVATFSCLLVLFKVCQPFNLLRGVLFASMFALFIVAYLTMYDLFSLAPLSHFIDGNFSKLLLMLFLMAASYALMAIFSNGYDIIKEKLMEYKKRTKGRV